MTSALPVPAGVTILSGFLGAGKTTLLNRMLQGDHGVRIGVIVNDFGALQIDAQLVVDVDDGMVSLANGCVYCSLRDDLLVAARSLMRRSPPPEHVVIEASGVSDPFPIGMAFRMPPLSALFRLDSIVALVDAEQLPLQSADARSRALIERQVEAANIVVLNKCDLVSDHELDRRRAWIGERAPRALVWETRAADVPLRLLLDAGRFEVPLPDADPGHDHENEHIHAEDSFSCWSWQSDSPLNLAAVQRVFTSLPPTVIRAKGVLQLAELPEQRGVMHVVGRRLTIVPGAPWGASPPATRLVVIGTVGGVPAAQLEQRLRGCIAGATAG